MKTDQREIRCAVAIAVLVAAAFGKATEADSQDTEKASEQSSDPLSGSFELEPRVFLVVNAVYGDRPLLPGSYGLFAVRPIFGGDQFQISPSNTTLGFSAGGVSLDGAEFSAALDVNLKTPTPLTTANVLAPQFYSAYIELAAQHLKIRMGQYPDIILPFVAPTTNGFPGSYLPGSLGFTRPQLRSDVRVPIGEDFQLLLQGSLSRPIQTFQIAEEFIGAGAGLPDLQGRLALAFGDAGRDPWQRPYVLSVSGHVGRRRFVGIAEEGVTGVEFNTWSIGGGLRAELPTGTTLQARIWRGSLLGDYMGGVFQTVSGQRLEPVGAHGFVVTARQNLPRGWAASAGLGRDNPRDGDLGPGERALNQAGFANLFWDWSRKIGFALEGSRWRTSYIGQGSTRVWRVELMSTVRL